MTREGQMDGDPERRFKALEQSQGETLAKLDRLLEHSIANAEKLAIADAKLSVVDAKLDGKASAAEVAAIGAKLEAKASVADVARLEPLVGVVAELAADIRTLRDNAWTDYRVLFGALITITLGLAALMAKGFQWL